MPSPTQNVVLINHATGNVDLLANGFAAAAANLDTFVNDGATLVWVNNASGGALTVTETFGVNGKVDGVTPTSPTKTVATGKSAILGPYPIGPYNDVNGFMNIGWSTHTGVTWMPFKPGV